MVLVVVESRVLFAVLAVLALWLPARATAAPSVAEAFAAPAAFQHVALSPSGTRIAVVGWKDSKQAIRIYEVGRLSAGPTAEYILGPAPSVSWLDWKSEDRIVFGLLMADATFLDSEGVLISRTMLVTADAKLKQFRNPVVKPGRATAMPQFHDHLLSLLHADPEHILLQIDWWNPHEPSIYRINLRTFKAERIIHRRNEVVAWLADPAGRLRAAMLDDRAGWRLADEAGQLSPLPVAWTMGSQFRPLGIDEASRLIALSNHEGETTGLYAYGIADGTVQTLFRDQAYDVEGAIWSRDGRRVLAAYHADDRYRVTPVDEGYARRLERVQALLGVDELSILSETLDASKVIAGVFEADRMTRVSFVDLETGTVETLGSQRPALDRRQLGRVFTVRYRARDGLEIPGFVTLPPGVETLEEAKRLPFVVMPHGGPHARDTADYDWWAQFTASLGYGVLQPNFRGSAGYGAAFEEAGRRQWGEAIQADVADGAAWLVERGYADPGRLCVAGGSFGGYTALVASIEDSGRYRCAVSLAGVSDLLSLIRQEQAFNGGAQAMTRLVGRYFADHERLSENSPARRAEHVGMPILLAHGDADTVVPVSHSRTLKRRLDAAGKSVTYLELPLADHSLSREKDRLAFLRAYEAFLRAHLGDGAAAPAG